MKRRSPLNNRRGVTLVEASCGLLIVSMILVAIYSCFLIVQKNFGQGDEYEQAAQSNFAQLELGDDQSAASGELSLSLGAATVSFHGRYLSTGTGGQGGALHSFETQQNSATGVRDAYIQWKLLMDGMTDAERVAAGYPRWTDNSSLRDWMRTNLYDGNWPTVPEALLAGTGLPSTLYVQPYFYSSAGDVNTNCFIFANAAQGNNWNAYLVYDHTEQAWYRRSDNRTYGVSNKTWAELQAEIHSSAWVKLG